MVMLWWCVQASVDLSDALSLQSGLMFRIFVFHSSSSKFSEERRFRIRTSPFLLVVASMFM